MDNKPLRTMRFIYLLNLLFFSNTVIGQEAKMCPCEKVWINLAPDSSVVHQSLEERRINTSYISWNRFVALGNAEGYPEMDKTDDYPVNYHTYNFGCPRSVVYDKTTKARYNGELVFTRDDEDLGLKNIVAQRTQIVDGLKDGYELYFNVDQEKKCYFPSMLIFFKAGEIYQKVFSFEYRNGGLYKSSMESYNEEGQLYGPTKVYDNGLVFIPNGKSYTNKEKLVYEAFILKHPSSSCEDVEYKLWGNGNVTQYSANDESVSFKGRRVQYAPENGLVHWEEEWQDGRIVARKSYYHNPPGCPQKTGMLGKIVKYTYITDATIIEEQVEYFDDCKSSIKQIRSTRNYTSTGAYELYSAPGRLKEKGMYNDLGEMHGVWEYYTYDGTIQKRTTFKDGVENGIEEIFNEKGELIRKVRYENGEVVEVLD